MKNVAEGLVKRGHTVVVAGYYASAKACANRRDENGVIIYDYSLGYQASKLGRLLYTAMNVLHIAGFIARKELAYYEGSLSGLIEKHNIDILELTDFYMFNFCRSSLNFRTFNIPVVMRFHGSAYYISTNRGEKFNTIKENDLKHFSRADYFSFVSSYLMGFVEEMGCDVKNKNSVVIYNMVEDGFLYRNENPSASHTILFFGKLVKTKGAHATVQAFSRFYRTHPNWKLVMAGSDYNDTILDGVSQEIRGHIEFPGFCSRERIKNYIDDCSFVCLPSYFEACSMSLLEVMARSKAVIFTSRTSGPEMIEDGKDGMLVDPDDIEMICDRMTKLADDSALCNFIAKSAYDKVERHLCANRILDEFEYFYKSIAV